MSFGVVHTAYTNGAAVQYLQNVLNIPTACVPTGVKHLHARAHDFDIGIYFEPNGHGTVLFSEHARQVLASKPEFAGLNALSHLLNPYTGCAVANLLAFLGVLICSKFTKHEWISLYQPRFSTLLRVEVADRTLVRTSQDECTVVQPPHLQAELDAVLKKVFFPHFQRNL